MLESWGGRALLESDFQALALFAILPAGAKLQPWQMTRPGFL